MAKKSVMLDEDLVRLLQKEADRTESTVDEIANDLMRSMLKAESPSAPRPRPVTLLGGPLPGSS